MATLLSFLYSKVGELLSPPTCVYCQNFLAERTVLCGECQSRVQYVPSFRLMVTQKTWCMVYAVGAYQDPLKSLIMAKRYGDRVASKQLGELLWRHTQLPQLPCDVLVPVPLHWTRYARRGYNQAEVMAQHVAAHNGATVVSALSRSRATAFQAGLSIKDRKKNVREVFTLRGDGHALAGKHVVLVDDLITTGATLNEAVNVVMQAHPASVAVVVACRVV